PRCSSNTGNVRIPFATAVGINVDLYGMSWPHVGELGFLEVGRDPDFTKRNNGHQVLSVGYVRSYLHGALAYCTIYRCHDGRVRQIELCLIEGGLGSLRQGIGGLRLSLGSGHHVWGRPRVMPLGGGLFD